MTMKCWDEAKVPLMSDGPIILGGWAVSSEQWSRPIRHTTEKLNTIISSLYFVLLFGSTGRLLWHNHLYNFSCFLGGLMDCSNTIIPLICAALLFGCNAQLTAKKDNLAKLKDAEAIIMLGYIHWIPPHFAKILRYVPDIYIRTIWDKIVHKLKDSILDVRNEISKTN